MRFKKNIVIAATLSAIVFVGAIYFRTNIFAPGEQTEVTGVTFSQAQHLIVKPVYDYSSGAVPLQKTITLHTSLFAARFSPVGGALSSLHLLEHKDSNGQPVEMLLIGTSGKFAGMLSFGSPDAPLEQGIYRYRQVDENTHVFTCSYQTTEGSRFQVEKSWRFVPGEYLFSLQINILPEANGFADFSEEGPFYTLTLGPEIGPPLSEQDSQYEYRRFTSFTKQGKRYPGLPAIRVLTSDENVCWVAVESRYFAVIGIPSPSVLSVTYDKRPIPGLVDHHELMFSRPLPEPGEISDTYYIFAGPKQKSVLTAYNSEGGNSFALSGQRFESLIEPGKLLKPLVNLFDALLRQFYFRLIPNYGINIIFLALLIKLLIFPLSRKSTEMNLKIRKLQPEVWGLKERYSADRGLFKQKLSELYQKEGITPMMSLLPLLIQLPVFIALYRLLGTTFDLRGTVFIPGILTDLSLPDSLIGFGDFRIPVLGWQALRLLPLLMLAVTLVQTRITQPPNASFRQMNIASYLVPVLLFLVLYQMPSGVVLYWIAQTVFSIGEHFIHVRRYQASTAA